MTSTVTIPATDKQVSFMLSLLDERDTYGLAWTYTIESLNAWVAGDKSSPCPVSKSAATDFIGSLLKQPKKIVTVTPVSTTITPPITTTQSTWQRIQHVGTSVPTSKYALPRADMPGAFDFFEVKRAKTTGNIYVVKLTGSPTYWSKTWLGQADQLRTLRQLVVNPMGAAVAYATVHGRCAVCNAYLSDPKSIAQSMGPVCVKKFN